MVYGGPRLPVTQQEKPGLRLSSELRVQHAGPSSHRAQDGCRPLNIGSQVEMLVSSEFVASQVRIIRIWL